MNERTLEMTYKINGNLLYTQQIEISSDSNTLTMTRHIAGESETNIRVFERQSKREFTLRRGADTSHRG